MSQDLLLKHVCPHRVVEEWLAIDETDRRSLRPQRIPSAANVEVKVNGVLVPPSGVHSAVEVTGALPQPFTIVSGFNDRLVLTLNNETLTYLLPVGNRVLASTIIKSLEGQQGEDDRLVFTEEGGRVKVATRDKGDMTTLFFEEGSGHQTLGLPSLRFFRGRTAIPGWELVKDVAGEDTELVKKILFHTALPSTDDLILVSYTTRASWCPRCLGVRVEDDIRYDEFGEPVWARNTELLLQEVQKIVLTIKGSNVFHTWYGTSLMDLVGTKAVGGLDSAMVNEIQLAIARYRDIKRQQAAYQEVTDQEFLQRVTALEVVQDDLDPTVFYVSIGLQSRSSSLSIYQESIRLQGNQFDGFQIVG